MPMHGKQPSGLLTQQRMLRSAVALFLEKGYEKTTTAEISRAAGMSPSAFFRAYESKEQMLLALVQHMFAGQFSLAAQQLHTDEPVLLYAAETALQLHIAELSEPLRDLYVTAYSLPSTTQYLYRTTARRLSAIFRAYLPQASEQDFYELEIASGSVMRGFMAVPCGEGLSMEQKLRRFLSCCLTLYAVPEREQAAAVQKVLSLPLAELAEHMVRQTVRLSEQGLLTDAAAPETT